MGRGTFEVVRAFPRWPYGSKPVVVLSGGPIGIPAQLSKSVEHMRGSPQDVVARLEARGWRRIYVDGAGRSRGSSSPASSAA